MNMPVSITTWTADEVAECLPISLALSGRLWELLDEATNRTPLGGDGSNGTVETPDGRIGDEFDDQAPHWWGKLTEAEQAEIAGAVERERNGHEFHATPPGWGEV